MLQVRLFPSPDGDCLLPEPLSFHDRCGVRVWQRLPITSDKRPVVREVSSAKRKDLPDKFV